MIPGAVAFERQRGQACLSRRTSFEVAGRLPGGFVLNADAGPSSGLVRSLGKNVIGHLRVRPGRGDSPFSSFCLRAKAVWPRLLFLSTEWTLALKECGKRQVAFCIMPVVYG